MYKCDTTRYDTTRYNTIRYHTIQCNTICYNARLHNTTQQNTIQSSTGAAFSRLPGGGVVLGAAASGLAAVFVVFSFPLGTVAAVCLFV